MAPVNVSYSGSHTVSGSGPRNTPLAISGGGATSDGGSPRGTMIDWFTSHRWMNVQLCPARIVAMAPARTARDVGGRHLAGVEVDVEQVALRRQPDQLETGLRRQHRPAELLDDQRRTGRGGGPLPGRGRSGLGRVDGDLLRGAVSRLLQRRRRRTGRQVTAAGLRDHPDDSDGDRDTGTDADAAASSAIEWRTPWRLRHGRFERDMALARPLLNELDLDPLAHSPSITPQHRPAVGSEAREEASPGPSATLWSNERTGSSLERRAERVAAATDPRT